MSFTATPTDGSATPIPMSSVVPDGGNTIYALEGGPSKATGGNTLAPAAVYAYDGYLVTIGAKTDARDSHTDGTAITAMQVWKQISYLLGSTIAADGTMMAGSGLAIGASDGTNLQTLLVQSAANPNLRVTLYSGTNILGVDQNNELRTSLYGKNAAAGDTNLHVTSGGDVYVARDATTVLNQASAAQTANGNSGDLIVGPYTEISIDINITADSGTSQTIQFFWERKGADGNYYPLWQTSVLSSSISTPYQISTSVGAGMAYNQSLGSTGRLRWVIAGTTPSFTFSASVIGK